jgi:hypothetical protein
METWSINSDILKSIRAVAHDWTQGVAILRPFDGDFVILAVTRVDAYSPSNNIHHTTVCGKDITLMVQQKLSFADPRGASPLLTKIDTIKEEQTWEIPHHEKWYWIKVREVS